MTPGPSAVASSCDLGHDCSGDRLDRRWDSGFGQCAHGEGTAVVMFGHAYFVPEVQQGAGLG